MKIAVYEVREDEKLDLAEQEKKYGIGLVLTSSNLNAESIALAEGCEGVSTLGRSRLNREMLTALHQKGVRYVSTRTIGFDHIDVKAAKELGMRVSNAWYAPNGVADHTVMLILLAIRKYKPALWRGQVNDYSLAGLQGRELRSLTVGVIGTGKIGAALIQNLTGFGCRLICYDPWQNPNVAKVAEYVSLETLYREADIISIHLPLNDETRYFINDDAISRMKDGVVLVNCARGELMDIPALIRNIENEKIGALALDVFENEIGIYHEDRRSDILKNRDMAYLRQFPNVIMTQHMAFYTKEAVQSMVETGIGSLAAFSEGKDYFTELK